MAGRFGVLNFEESAATGAELDALRRHQAAFRTERERLDRQNQWMAIPALGPAMAVMGLEVAAARAAAIAPAAAKALPLRFTARDPYLRVGDNHWTRVGRRAHKAHQERVDQKPGWDAERPRMGASGRIVRPDTESPRDYLMELKPNTPSGRAAGARAVKRYKEETGRRTRAIFYDPKSIK